MDEFRILSTTAILGYGFPVSSFEAGMARNPHLIAVDAGSTDPGPYYLGAGISFTDRDAVKRDLELMLLAGIPRKIPIVIGTAGGSGGDRHLAWNREIIEEIAREQKLSFRMAVIHAELSTELVAQALKEGKVTPLTPGQQQLEKEHLQETVSVVAQMGIEPIIKALDEGAQVVLAGRCYDPAVFAAPAVRAGFDKGLAIHLGKILECASIAATPGSGSDCMFGYLRADHFDVEPLNPIRKCTTLSVAAHTLYEKTDPYILPGPGGHLDLRETRFEQLTDSITRVSGSRYVNAQQYTIKLEGARRIGYRTVAIAGARDPILLKQIDEITQGVTERVADNFKNRGFTYKLLFTIYGRDGVMGSLEPVRKVEGHEIGIVIEAVSDTQAHADTICAAARSTMLHYGYTGRRATAGNLAFPYSPSDFHAGEVYVFSVYHLLSVDDPCAHFPCEMVQV
ncbi:MAG: acyclic terpene utilization AtuA family protein [Christensenellales bacterium]